MVFLPPLRDHEFKAIMAYRDYKEKAPWYDVRSWSRWTWAAVVATVVVIIVAAIARGGYSEAKQRSEISRLLQAQLYVT